MGTQGVPILLRCLTPNGIADRTLKVPSYAWKCHECHGVNPPYSSSCVHCGFLAVARALDIPRIQAEQETRRQQLEFALRSAPKKSDQSVTKVHTALCPNCKETTELPAFDQGSNDFQCSKCGIALESNQSIITAIGIGVWVATMVSCAYYSPKLTFYFLDWLLALLFVLALGPFVRIRVKKRA